MYKRQIRRDERPDAGIFTGLKLFAIGVAGVGSDSEFGLLQFLFYRLRHRFELTVIGDVLSVGAD